MKVHSNLHCFALPRRPVFRFVFRACASQIWRKISKYQVPQLIFDIFSTVWRTIMRIGSMLYCCLQTLFELDRKEGLVLCLTSIFMMLCRKFREQLGCIQLLLSYSYVDIRRGVRGIINFDQLLIYKPMNLSIPRWLSSTRLLSSLHDVISLPDEIYARARLANR